jgi:hypothetical protein
MAMIEGELAALAGGVDSHLLGTAGAEGRN